MGDKIKNFRDLNIWKLGKELVIDIYEVTKSFPTGELYGLVSQMRRSAVSIPANIAEGFNRIIIRNTNSFFMCHLDLVQN